MAQTGDARGWLVAAPGEKRRNDLFCERFPKAAPHEF